MLQCKNLGEPDQVRRMGEGRIDFVSLDGMTLGRAVFQPGWRWTTDARPIAGTELCQVRHLGMVVSGRSGVRLSDGTEIELKAGDVFDIPPGHDAWTIGDEPYVSLDVVTPGPNAAPASNGRGALGAPEHHTVLLENDSVRVLDVRIPAGATSGRHSHPKSVVYQLSETKVRMTPDGGSAQELVLKPGQITWTPGGVHTVENLGPNDDWGIIVELKSS